MSWIKDNKFVVGLTGGTLAGVALLYVAGAKGQSDYAAASEQYQSAQTEVANCAKTNPYPSADNRDAKKKALEDYRKDLTSLQSAFDSYRSGELKNLTPEEFANRLKSANKEIREALSASNTKVPDAFYCGFETYQSKLANGKVTGVLNYQLEGVKSILQALAKAGVSQLTNVHRPLLAEESGGEAYQPKPGDVAQALPLELAFVGPEKSVREFLSSLNRLDGRFVVVRTIRITSTKADAPKVADAKFQTASVKDAGGAKADDAFGGGFVLPDDDSEKKPANEAKKPAKPAAKPAESGRVLSQVLGLEEVQVFVRLDMLRFLPAQKLP